MFKHPHYRCLKYRWAHIKYLCGIHRPSLSSPVGRSRRNRRSRRSRRSRRHWPSIVQVDFNFYTTCFSIFTSICLFVSVRGCDTHLMNRVWHNSSVKRWPKRIAGLRVRESQAGFVSVKSEAKMSECGLQSDIYGPNSRVNCCCWAHRTQITSSRTAF